MYEIIVFFVEEKNIQRDYFNEIPPLLCCDKHPSIPHGHGIQKTSLRLDPYKRIVFEKHNGLNQIGFEDKRFIKFLWNDNNFRKYTLQAIANFISSGIVGKRYNWFDIRGIHNPRKLPKKRK